MVEMVRIHREVPVKYDVDVFVAGGGPAGIAAAVSAARKGAAVYLAEGQACLGGMGTSGMLPAFMQFTDGINFVAGGIGQEVYDKLRNHSESGYGGSLNIKAEALKRLYDELFIEAQVNFTLHTQLIGIEKENGEVSMAILSAKSGIFAVKAKMFIDCTGDGDLAAWAGAEYEKGDAEGNMMPATLCSLWTGIEWEKFDRKAQEGNLEKAFKDKVFSVEDRHLPGMWHVSDKVGGGNIGHAFGVDGTDEISLTKALIEQRKRILEYERYYKEYLEGYEKMELVTTGALLGVRETRRIWGDYVLILDDFKKRAVFEDEIGRYCYPVDVHASKPDVTSFKKFEEEHLNMRYAKGESYGIPYRILTPKGLSNVLVAGRCISADRYMQGSIRVMPGCFITGQAAGIAASLAVKGNTDTRGVNVKLLQQSLREIGAYLPNFKETV